MNILCSYLRYHQNEEIVGLSLYIPAHWQRSNRLREKKKNLFIAAPNKRLSMKMQIQPSNRKHSKTKKNRNWPMLCRNLTALSGFFRSQFVSIGRFLPIIYIFFFSCMIFISLHLFQLNHRLQHQFTLANCTFWSIHMKLWFVCFNSFLYFSQKTTYIQQCSAGTKKLWEFFAFEFVLNRRLRQRTHHWTILLFNLPRFFFL